ncbi:hypothetical protein GQ53DRAFT_757703 [Thozetella sp. PMI_491]|nr:hypothetical protein GQ53DRAFT_757703 [Thozetella sp. PMI_491]
MALSGLLIVNVVMLGFGGILSVPAFKSQFLSQPEQQKIIVRISAGDQNSTLPGADLGGDCPSVTLYRVTGDLIGMASGSSRNLNDRTDTSRGIQNGGNQKLSVQGSQNPEYIKIFVFGNDAVCIN